MIASGVNALQLEPRTTAPPAAQGARLQATAFAFASCQYPAGLLDKGLAGQSIDRLDQRVGSKCEDPNVAALLLLGDQIYADASYGLLDPKEPQTRYRAAHDAWWRAIASRTHLSALDQRNRLFFMPDDHEIADNWEPSEKPDQQRIKGIALEEFARSRGSRQPGSLGLGFWGPVPVGGGHEVFMLDTRTQRKPRPWGPGSPPARPHIIDRKQRSGLEHWLTTLHAIDVKQNTVAPKFISSAVWLLPRHTGRLNAQGDTDVCPALSDSWDGYPESLHWLLTLIASKGIRGVVVLCGDGHLAGHTVARLTCDHREVALHVLHAPALYAPFPFANARPHEYAGQEPLSWMWASDRVVCTVQSDLWPIGNGFVLVDVAQDKGAWRVTATFDTDAASTAHTVSWTTCSG
jgi:phosphodiesterase/alkaline phosphatase D-like protein